MLFLEPFHSAIESKLKLLYNGSRASFRIPLFFTYIKHYKQNIELTFSLPIGEFKFVPLHDDTLLRILKVALLHRSQMTHRFEHGMLSLQKSKDRFFKCLIAYKLSGEKGVHMRFITVRAGVRESCYDICQQHLFDLLPHPPVFFNVLARDITSELEF